VIIEQVKNIQTNICPPPPKLFLTSTTMIIFATDCAGKYS